MKIWILTILFFTFTYSYTQAQFAGGDGTENNPWQVATLEQLQSIGDNLDDHFIQIGNIDAGATADWNDGNGFNPIGDEASPFTGSYDGAEFEITDLTIIRPNEDHVGLFGFVVGGQIENTGLVNVLISGRNATGGLVGDNQGQISNSYATGRVTGRAWAGGLAGQNVEGQIINSYADVEVSDNYEELNGISAGEKAQQVNSPGNTSELSWKEAVVSFSTRNNANSTNSSNSTTQVTENIFLGGLVGGNFNGEISESYALGNVTGSSSVIGGLAGANNSRIIDSFASGNVTASGNAAGGLVGSNVSEEMTTAEISGCFASGNVTGSFNVIGGLVGGNAAGEITNSYATGMVSGENEVGGLTGVNIEDGNVAFSYAAGLVTGTGDVGGLIGLNESSVESVYWDIEATGQGEGVGQGSSEGITGLTSAQMTGESAIEFLSALDFELTWRVTESYPALIWEDRITSVEHPDVPLSYDLQQNYPNPFNPTTQISFTIPEQTHVRLEVYNTLGQLVATLVNERKSAGSYVTTFHASGLASGIYLYRLQTDTYSQSRQLLLLK